MDSIFLRSIFLPVKTTYYETHMVEEINIHVCVFDICGYHQTIKFKIIL